MLLTAEAIKLIQWHAQNEVPFECCGILTLDGKAVACTNVAQDRTRQFSISAYELKRLRRQHSIAGFYHSHVNGPAIPSSVDIAGPNYPGMLYAVASVEGGYCREVRLYRWARRGSKRTFEPVLKNE